MSGAQPPGRSGVGGFPPSSTGGGPADRPGNGLGLAALIVGIAALVLAVIPFASFGAWVLGLVAVGLAVGGLAVRNRPRGTSIAGLVVGILAVLVVVVISIVTIVGTASVIGRIIESATVAPLEPVPSEPGVPRAGATVVVYEVETDGSTIRTVAYATLAGASFGQETEHDVIPPFERTYEVVADADARFVSLVAQASNDATSITCRILVDGESITERSATGPAAVVTCVGAGG
ncbi:MmpS family transport accessory protein [Agromyces seonyuensis]|uniref:DUF4190 domain-containing protein n=1 Tax=Agromyces seonyuensis TaxID=2662446 RepID=A0A6I4P1L7_9MICO|nr:MmpS family transport accessory protein [Agromyces seonyuensis]MWB97014.1 hypothetical protein [Agromyces seonyuensis]